MPAASAPASVTEAVARVSCWRERSLGPYVFDDSVKAALPPYISCLHGSRDAKGVNGNCYDFRHLPCSLFCSLRRLVLAPDSQRCDALKAGDNYCASPTHRLYNPSRHHQHANQATTLAANRHHSSQSLTLLAPQLTELPEVFPIERDCGRY